MEISLNKISTGFKGERCYVHARGVILPNGFGVITMQKLELSGSDIFYGIEMVKTQDFGKTFTPPTPCANLSRVYCPDGTSYVMCDATPFYHKATGKIILTGHMAWYGADNKRLKEVRPISPLYAVYNEATGTFDRFKKIEIPNQDEYYLSGTGCSQIVECAGGELIIPFYYTPKNTEPARHEHFSAALMRCSFDGEDIKMLELGSSLTNNVARGFCEPSVVSYGNEYFLCLRNDKSGYVAKSSDGLNYSTPIELCFDNGENLGSYNTQQHWLVGGGKLWLVYTRKAGDNGHIFRHRAPLYIAEVDPERLCVKADTEMIAVPKRGARLGNFGCQSFTDGIGYVFAAEWMQDHNRGWQGCVENGSDNSIFISKILF